MTPPLRQLKCSAIFVRKNTRAGLRLVTTGTKPKTKVVNHPEPTTIPKKTPNLIRERVEIKGISSIKGEINLTSRKTFCERVKVSVPSYDECNAHFIDVHEQQLNTLSERDYACEYPMQIILSDAIIDVNVLAN